jgi:hypothetical protein
VKSGVLFLIQLTISDRQHGETKDVRRNVGGLSGEVREKKQVNMKGDEKLSDYNERKT